MPTQRVFTGIPGLDDLLYGGFLEGDAVLVAGAPGTGKSTLGMQYIYEGIMQYDEPGFFITFEEFPQQIYRDAMNFGWDFRGLEEEDKLKVLFTSPDLMYQDIKRHEGIFPEMIREIGAKRVVVDSITHFQRLASNSGELREIIYSLINALKREGLTPLLLRELVEGEVLGTVAEEYTADAVVHLTMDRVGAQRMRFLEVLKSRGTRHVAAKSFFTLHDHGITVVPPYQEAFFRYQEAISTGIPDLDSLMGGGIPYGAFYLFEVAPEFHQEILELNLIRETNRAQDHLFELATSTVYLDKLKGTAHSYGMENDLQEALSNNALQVFPLFEAEEGGPQLSLTEELEEEEELDEAIGRSIGMLDEAFQQTHRTHRGRVLLDCSRLSTALNDGFIYGVLNPVLEMVQKYGGVCVGLVNPEAMSPDTRARLLMEADGIVRLWREGNYTYVQVIKTVNSVLTPVHCLVETNTPPYLLVQD
ncbi:MAG: RAD55 family ATPase [Armatimonadota bacterium]